jgi:2-amino-4-hydroxy-6-hydroxymethyldihydropteridine diphosphokinase
VVLLMGSNVGDRQATLAVARNYLEAGGLLRVARASSTYETEPVDAPKQRWFLNQALLVHTALEPGMLLSHCRSVEDRLGRRRNVPKGPRTLDVDILLYGSRVIDTPLLTLPHPATATRRCALVPLLELDTGWVHPKLNGDVRELLRACRDASAVRLILPELQE